MNTMELCQILSRDPFTKKYFLDVFPSDQLPYEIFKYPTCLIANVDSSAEPGSHWIAFFLRNSQEIEFFDSYGHSPAFYEGPIFDFASRFAHVNFNQMTLQSNVTAVCGQYCVYYLYSRCRGQSLKTFLSNFVTNHISNDKRVYNFVWKRFHVRTHFFQ